MSDKYLRIDDSAGCLKERSGSTSSDAGKIIAATASGRLDDSFLSRVSRHYTYMSSQLSPSDAMINTIYATAASANNPISVVIPAASTNDSRFIVLSRDNVSTTAAATASSTTTLGGFSSDGNKFAFSVGNTLYVMTGDNLTEVITTPATGTQAQTNTLFVGNNQLLTTYVNSASGPSNIFKYSTSDYSLISSYLHPSPVKGLVYYREEDVLYGYAVKSGVASSGATAFSYDYNNMVVSASATAHVSINGIALAGDNVYWTITGGVGDGILYNNTNFSTATLGGIATGIYYSCASDGNKLLALAAASGGEVEAYVNNVRTDYYDLAGTMDLAAGSRFLLTDDSFVAYTASLSPTDRPIEVLDTATLTMQHSLTSAGNRHLIGFWSNGTQKKVAYFDTTTNPTLTIVTYGGSVITNSVTIVLPYQEQSVSFISAGASWVELDRKPGIVPNNYILAHTSTSADMRLVTSSDVSFLDYAPIAGTTYLTVSTSTGLTDERSALAAEGLITLDGGADDDLNLLFDDQYIEWYSQRNPATTLVTVATEGTTLVPTLDGTETVVTDSTGTYINEATTTLVNAIAGWSSATLTHTQTQFDPIFTMTIKTGGASTDIQACRIWCGLFSATPETSDDPAIHGAGFRYSTAVDGTAFWRTWTNDGSGTGTVTTTTTAIAADTRYILKLVLTASSAKFYIDGALVATHTTDLPSSTQGLNYFLMITNTTAGTARNLRIQKVHCKQK